MRFAIIENNTVTNIVEAEQEFASTMGWILSTGNISIGDTYNNGTFNKPVIVPDVSKIKEEIVTKTQLRLDQWAMTKNYDGILSASTYATSTIPQFKSDGQDAVNNRDLTWSKLYQILAQVEAGTLAMPNSFSDIEPLLPTLTWTIQ